MNEPQGSETNTVERLLSRHFQSGQDGTRRQALLLQTTRVLRRRRRLGQGGLVLVLSFCYLAGIGTMYLLGLIQAPDSGRPLDRQSNIQVVEVLPPPAPSEDAALPLEQDPDVPAVVLERLASASEGKRAQLYRRAGDRYLEVERDLRSALRCYRQFFQTSSETDLTISAEDNWLLISLKQSKQKEKDHGKSAG